MNSALRATVLQEWRGLPQPRPRRDRWQQSSELLPALMQKLGLKERLRESEVIEAAPVALREGTLYVRVLQPSLHYELEQIAKAQILRKLKQRFGHKTIRDLRFRLG